MRKIIDKEIEVRGNLSRKQIRDKVLQIFLEEPPGEGYDHEYHYHVETLEDGSRMFLKRPTRRFDFDFFIQIENWSGKGSHQEVYDDLDSKYRDNQEDFELLFKAIKDVHDGRDVDDILKECTKLRFRRGWTVELLLKLLKWMFILEDIYYWNYEGRDKLMRALDQTYRQPKLT
jgi:hypothetical protein